MYVPVDFKFQIKQYKFFNEKFFKGKEKPVFGNFNTIEHNIDIQNKNLVNQYDRLFHFTYIVKFLPKAGEIGFDGEFILESPNQNNIELLLKFSDSFKMKIEYTIIKNAYIYAEKIAKDNGIWYLPSEIFLKEYGETVMNKIKEFNEKARKSIEKDFSKS